jgi:pyridoxine 5-phosphate synthase
MPGREREIRPELGVNIDHVATLREARRTNEPDPVWAAVLAELGGADAITLHLREDRRHIQERDLRLMRETVKVKLNLELACDAQMLAIAVQVKPDYVTLVPERREEITTEGGLDAKGHLEQVEQAVDRLREVGIGVSLFIDAEPAQIDAARHAGADAVELHTGQYALARPGEEQAMQLKGLADAARRVVRAGLALHAGHGLTYRNVAPVAAIRNMKELNIGHSIVARAVMVGLQQAVREMKELISSASE